MTSGEPVSNSLIETLPSSSRLSRSTRWRLVRNLPSLPANGEVLTPNVMRSTGSSTVSRVQRDRCLGRGDGVADLDLGEPGDDEQVAGRQLLDLVAADALERHQLGEPALQRRLALGELLLEQGDGLAAAHHAVDDPADGQATEVLAGVERGDHRLQRRSRDRPCGAGMGSMIVSSSGDRSASSAGMPMPTHRLALAGDGGDDLEVDVVIAGVEVDEQLVDLVEHLVGAGVPAIDLVDDDDRRQVEGERLLQHVAGLRQRPLGGVDEQQHAVDHRQRPLDLAAEVGVAGRVDQVDLDALPRDRGGLGEDGDAPLALLVVGVHDAVDHRLVGGEGAGGAQQRVDESGLAVVDVRDQGNVTKRSMT